MKERANFSNLFALEFLVATPLMMMKMNNGKMMTQRGIKRMNQLVSRA
jgi:hypothetical protein